jgi:hypothetical protein
MFSPEAFQPQAFGESSGEPAFQGVAFDGGAFHIEGEGEAATSGRVAYGFRRQHLIPLLDEGEELFALV